MILVLSTYRTGSTNFCKQLEKDTGYENLDEYFHESFALSHSDRIRYITKTKKCIVKVFPYHLNSSPRTNLLSELLDVASRIIFLIRKDFDQQVQSYYICKYTNDWHSSFTEQKEIILDRSKYNWCTNFLHNQYLELDTIRSSLSNHETIYTHQLDQSKKYVRPVKWDRQPGFTNIDIEEIFY